MPLWCNNTVSEVHDIFLFYFFFAISDFQRVEEKSSSDVKQPPTAEKKASTDESDDPFGALDWKDGIATLPGNISGKEHPVLSPKTTSIGLYKRAAVLNTEK